MEQEVFFTGFPYAESFSIIHFCTVKQNSPIESRITYGFGKRMLKSTFFEALLEIKSKGENRSIFLTALKPAMLERA